MATDYFVYRVSGQCSAQTQRIDYATPGDLNDLRGELRYLIEQMVQQVGTEFSRELDSLANRFERRVDALDRRIQGLEGQLHQFRQQVEAHLAQLEDALNMVRGTLHRLGEQASAIAAAVDDVGRSTARSGALLDQSRDLIAQQTEQLEQDLARIIAAQDLLTELVRTTAAAVGNEGQALRRKVEELAESGAAAVDRVERAVCESGEQLSEQVDTVQSLWEEQNQEAREQAARREGLTEEILSTSRDSYGKLSQTQVELAGILEQAQRFERHHEHQRALADEAARTVRLKELTAAAAASRTPTPGTDKEDAVVPLFEAILRLPVSPEDARLAYGEFQARNARLPAPLPEGEREPAAPPAVWLRSEAPRLVATLLELGGAPAFGNGEAGADTQAAVDRWHHCDGPSIARLLEASQHLARRQWAEALQLLADSRDLHPRLVATLSSCFHLHGERGEES